MIETSNSTIASDMRTQFLNHLQAFNVKGAKTVVVNHFGEFSQDLVNSVALSVEENMVHAGDQKKVVKRVFSILIEALQNIRLHGERDENGKQLSFLFLTKTPLAYTILFGNLINKSDKDQIESYLKKINGMDNLQLKELYSDILTNGFLSKKGGAGLGFLTMRMKSDNELRYTFEELDSDKIFFSIEVNINRAE